MKPITKIKTMIHKVEPIARCKRCGHQMYPSFIGGYYSQCFNCDEDFYSIEYYVGDLEDKKMDIYIRDWYMANYPTDECGSDINPDAVFYTDRNVISLFDVLDYGWDTYDYLSTPGCIPVDSVIRERCFGKLAEIMDCDVSYIYEQWHNGRMLREKYNGN